jgi:hypothetical protein
MLDVDAQLGEPPVGEHDRHRALADVPATRLVDPWRPSPAAQIAARDDTVQSAPVRAAENHDLGAEFSACLPARRASWVEPDPDHLNRRADGAHVRRSLRARALVAATLGGDR